MRRVTGDRGPVLALPGGAEVSLSTDLESLLEETKPDVLVDFTNASACMEAALLGAASSTHLVLGASGLTDDDLARLDALANDKGIGVIVAPNFALGAVVLKRLVEQAAGYFDYVDIVESHHEGKIDAPSGFAMALAKSIGDNKQFTRNQTEKENLPGSRGAEYNGVTIHRRSHGRAERPPRGHLGYPRPDRIPASRYAGPRLLHARRVAMHPRGCESSGSCGRLGKYPRAVDPASVNWLFYCRGCIYC